jgi:hypothetical protein
MRILPDVPDDLPDDLPDTGAAANRQAVLGRPLSALKPWIGPAWPSPSTSSGAPATSTPSCLSTRRWPALPGAPRRPPEKGAGQCLATRTQPRILGPRHHSSVSHSLDFALASRSRQPSTRSPDYPELGQASCIRKWLCSSAPQILCCLLDAEDVIEFPTSTRSESHS